MVCRWVQQKAKEVSLFGAGYLLKQRAEVWVVDEEVCPVGCCSLGGKSKARTISGGEVGQSAGGVHIASGDSAEATGFIRPFIRSRIWIKDKDKDQVQL